MLCTVIDQFQANITIEQLVIGLCVRVFYCLSCGFVAAAPVKRPAEESEDTQKKRQKYEEEKVQRDKQRLAAKLDGSKTTATTSVPKPAAE